LWVTAPKGWLTLFAHLYLAIGAGYLAPVQMVDVEVMAAVGAFNLDQFDDSVGVLHLVSSSLT
jgi:hypothetical protein